MADRYWVGGTANWDGTAGTKWATTSGGAGGASVPTSADDVFFDAASGVVTCTVAAGNTGAKSINCTGFTGTLTQAVNINVAGNVTLVAGMTFTTSGFPTTTFTANATLITAGKTYAGVVVDGVGITVTLGSALTTAGLTVTVNRGTFDTANYNVTCPNFNSSNSNVRGFTLGSSTCTLSTGNNVVDFTTGTNLTFNAGTSQINCSAANAGFNASGQTFYNVAFTNTSAGTRIILGANTFNNLSVTAPSSAGVAQLTFNLNQTINGTLSTTGTAGNRRVWFRSDTYSVRRTLTVNSASSLTDADFRDIIVNGTSAPISGTRIGNRGQCSGITFDAPKTVYWNLAGAQNWSANGWATTSTGSPSTDNFPLPQDTATFTNAGSVTGTITLDTALAFTGTVDMSGRTSAMTLSVNNNTEVYGSWTNGSGTTISGTNRLTFAGQGTKTIITAGKVTQIPFTVSCIGGSLLLGDAYDFSGTSANMIVEDGTFDTAGYSFRVRSFTANTTTRYRRVLFRNSAVVAANGQSPFNLSGSANLFFDAGTSTVTVGTDGSGSAHITADGLTLYDVVVNLNFNVRDIQPNAPFRVSSFTVRNLTLQTSSPTNGVAEVRLEGNVIITGTLTVPTNTITQRIFFRSSILGTQRTLTVNSWVGTENLDFMDINLQGAVGTLSGTSFGDCGRNTNITFDAPKTVYWNLAGTQNWSAAAWALTSGGAPSVNNFPLAQDTIIFDDAGSAGTIAINGYYNIGNISGASRTTAITIAHTTGTMRPKFMGDFIVSSAFTFSSTSPAFRFNPNTLKTLSLNGATLGMDLEFQGSATGGYILGSAFTCTSIVYHFGGILNGSTYNFTAANFQAQQATEGSTVLTKQLLMGSGLWTITGNNMINPYNSTFAIDSSTITNFSSADIIFTSTSTADRVIGLGGGGYFWKKITIAGNGTRNNTLGGGNFVTTYIGELASTTPVAHTISLGGIGAAWVVGKWSVSGTLGNVVTVSVGNLSIAGSAVSGVDYLSMGSSAVASTSPAEFYAGANSTGTGAAPLFRTTIPAARTLYWVGGTGNWSDTARWSLSSGGAGGEALPRSFDDVIFDSASNATAYTATVNAVTGGIRCKALTIAGPATGNVTLAGSTAIDGIHGDVTLPATGLTRTYTGAITLSGSTTGKTFTTNGVTLSSATTVNGVGCGWILGSALSIGSQTLTVTNGSFDTGNYNVTAGSLSSSNNNTRTISLGSSTVTLDSTAGIGFATSTNLTFNAGTSQINLTTNSTLNGGSGVTFYDVSFTSTTANTRTLSGTNTFNNLTLNASATGLSQLSINADQTITGTLTCSGSSAIARGFVRSDTIGTTRTLTVGTLAANDCDFRDITIAGTAAGTSPTRAGDCGGNSGITFPAPKTVYRVGTNTTWVGSNSWALNSGDTGSNDNFPLAQDTAVIDNNTTLTGTLTIAGGTVFNYGSLDASTRTTGITLTFTSGNLWYGSITFGSGVTVSGTSAQTFSGRGTMTFTSAGKTITFPITVDTPTGTFQLGDAYSASNTITLTRGTLDAVSYNVTVTSFASNNSNVRTIDMGSGLWTLSATGTVWDVSLTNTTLNKETANIFLSNTTTTARTFSGGGLSYNKLTIGGATGVSTLTVNGNNTFTEIASTKTVAHTIALSTTSQQVGAWTVTGTSGNVVTITGNTSNLVYTGAGSLSGLDYLNLQGRAYGPAGEITSVWYAGANSTNSGSLGWEFAAAPTPPPVANANFFLLFA